MSNRTPCCIPDCRRTSADPFYEWICPKHWALLTKNERRVWARHKREARRFGQPIRLEAYNRTWQSLKRRISLGSSLNAPVS